MNGDKPVSAYYVDSVKSYALEDITVADASSLARTVGGTAVGNFTEWFDFGVYSFLTVIISKVFFAGAGWGTVAAFAGLAVSFVMRPVGGMFWGFLGDRIGRKQILAWTVILMASGTFALGLLPGYATIGLWAPVLLFVLRAVQGFSTGGEYVGAMTFMVEHAPDRRRGYLLSFLPVGTLSGYILGALIVVLVKHVLPHAALYAWGWRVPFLLAAPLGLIGLYVRLRLEESPVYEKAVERRQGDTQRGWRQVKATVVSQWRPILVCMGLVLTFNVTDYMLTGYMPTYLEDSLHAGNPLIIVVLVMVVIGLLVTLLGRLSDRTGRKPVMYVGSILLIVVSVPMFLLMFRGGDLMVFLGTLPMGLILLCFMATEPSTLPTLFPTEVRSGATAVGFNVSVSAFGGTTPLIADALVKGTGDLLMPAYILIVAGVVGIASLWFTREPVGKPLPGSGPTVATEGQAHRLAAYFRRRKRHHKASSGPSDGTPP
ncbi:MAG TPA: MFS transporter [Nevskiaceae bacterium]